MGNVFGIWDTSSSDQGSEAKCLDGVLGPNFIQTRMRNLAQKYQNFILMRMVDIPGS